MATQLKTGEVQTIHVEAGAANTGLTFTLSVAKNSVNFTAATSTVGELSGGWYYITTSAADVNSIGACTFRMVSGGVTIYKECQVGQLDDLTGSVATIASALTSQTDDLDTAVSELTTKVNNVLTTLQASTTAETSATWTEGVISIVRGDDYDGVAQSKINRNFTDTENDLTLWTCAMTWREKVGDETSMFTETVTPTLVSGDTYNVAFTVLNAVSSLMKPVSNYYIYDCQFISPSGTRSTRELGVVNVSKDVTLT